MVSLATAKVDLTSSSLPEDFLSCIKRRRKRLYIACVRTIRREWTREEKVLNSSGDKNEGTLRSGVVGRCCVTPDLSGAV